MSSTRSAIGARVLLISGGDKISGYLNKNLYCTDIVTENTSADQVNMHYENVEAYGKELEEKLEAFNISTPFKEERGIVEDVLFKSARLVAKSKMLVNIARYPEKVYKSKPKNKVKEKKNFICARCGKGFQQKQG